MKRGRGGSGKGRRERGRAAAGKGGRASGGRHGGRTSRGARRHGGAEDRPEAITPERVLAALGGRARPALSARALLARLGGRAHHTRDLKSALRTLLREGRIERADGRYRRARPDGAVEGQLVAPGRVVDDAGRSWRVGGADGGGDAEVGDRVLVLPVGRGGEARGRELRAELAEVLEAAGRSFVGIFEPTRGGGGEVTPYRSDTEWRLRVEAGDEGGAQRGEVVVATPLSGRGTRALGETEAEAMDAAPRRRGARAARRAARRQSQRGAAPVRGRQPAVVAAHIVERLGRPGDPEADFRAVVWRRRLRVEFDEAVHGEAEAAPSAPAPDELARRLDLRTLAFLTIDPATARDHDDAVCVEAGQGSAPDRLWVAIADVSHFVAEGSALDREALRRGNSVYFPDRAIPMLPERLSGELCSLRPDEDRLVLAAELEVDRTGAVVGARFHEAVIRSRARLSYEEAAQLLETPSEAAAARPHEHVSTASPAESESSAGAFSTPSAAPDTRSARPESPDATSTRRASPNAGPTGRASRDASRLDPDVVDALRRFGAIARRLMERRAAEGSLDFDLPGVEIVLDEERRPVDLVEEARTFAHRAIEEAMLAANRAVARHLLQARVPSIYRVHEPPLPTDLDDLRELLESFGLLPARRGRGGAKPDALDARDLSEALARAAGRPEERVVNLVALRAMRQARYHPENLGHFALGFDAYLHFTSPIRRYADLVVHRMLRRRLRGEVEADADALLERLERVALRISHRERLAMEAEREMGDLKKATFMRAHVGEEHDGNVAGVARHGLYVRLDAWAVEGLVPVADLPGYFEPDEHGRALVSRRSGARFALGDRVRIRVDRVDPVRAWITFALLEHEPGPRR